MMDQAENLRQMIRENDNIPVNKINANVIAVSSGKGGVGKSNLVSNLAISFASLGKKVVIVDADLGLANIEVLFGIIPRKNLSHVLYENLPINDALTDGPLGIKFLSGGSGLRELSQINSREQKRIIDSFNYLDDVFDIILIDTGAGVSDLVLNFVKAASKVIVITTPEPTSITDAYALIKIIKEDSDFIDSINLVVNRVDDEQEGEEVFNKLNTVSEKFLGVNLINLGFLPQDLNLITSVKKQSPVGILYPDCDYSRAVKNIAYKILDIEELDKKPDKQSNSFASRLMKFFGKE